MTNDINTKKKLLQEDNWFFNKNKDSELMVETRDNALMYSLFDKIGDIFVQNGINGLGINEDIRERTIIDNLVLLNSGLKELEEMLNDPVISDKMEDYLKKKYDCTENC